jgi:hypothetical protein
MGREACVFFVYTILLRSTRVPFTGEYDVLEACAINLALFSDSATMFKNSLFQVIVSLISTSVLDPHTLFARRLCLSLMLDQWTFLDFRFEVGDLGVLRSADFKAFPVDGTFIVVVVVVIDGTFFNGMILVDTIREG